MIPTNGREPFQPCHSRSHWNRRTMLKLAGASGIGWLTPVAEVLANPIASGVQPGKAKSIILLWLQGGPSQLETFDPHTNRKIAYGTRSIKTSLKNVEFAEGLEQTAELADSMTVIRNVVSREGDHERAVYNIKTGYRPDPTLEHPSIGAVLCHQLKDSHVEIPRHISILPTSAAARGGYLGNEYDAFRMGDPLYPQSDLAKRVDQERFEKRLSSLSVVDRAFSRNRIRDLDRRTTHRQTIDRAVAMMSSEQLAAFDIRKLPKAEQNYCGETPFGRACVAATRLVEVGVRCVEVTLSGWDTHANNHDFHTARKQILDPALSGLIRYLKEKSLFEQTIVVCAGEFGRTPSLNPAGGRDHWPHGFSIVMAGGGLPQGLVVGSTDPDGGRVNYESGIKIADLHATILHRVGVDHKRELLTPVGRPMKLSEGKPIPELI